MLNLNELISRMPVLPFIRQSDFAPRIPWRYPERRLLDYLLVYVQEGTFRVCADEEEYLFQPGEFCLIQPGSLVDLEGITNTITPFAHFDIFYHPNRELSFPTRAGQIDLSAYRHLLQPRLNDIYGIEVPVRLQPRNHSRFREKFILMVELWQQTDSLMQLKTQHLATEIVIHILEDHYQGKQDMHGFTPNFNWITSYFSFHLSEPLSVREMAERANLSPSRFSALFKQRYGVSPHQYLMTMRINHAKDLLSTTELSQQEIASYCGFADIHHFSKTFKRLTATTPGQWRTGL